MKITLENPSRMVVKENHATDFRNGLALMLLAFVLYIFSDVFGIFLYGFAVLAFVGGLIPLLTTRIITVVLDRGAGKCSMSSKSVLKREYKEFELARIKGVVIQSTIESSRIRRTYERNYHYVLKFVLDGGEEAPVEFGKVHLDRDRFLKEEHEQKRMDAQKIADFLGFQLVEKKPSHEEEAMYGVKEGLSPA